MPDPSPTSLLPKRKPAGPYPTSGVDVVVEIVSEDDTYQRLREKCRKYQEWGCGRIYVVDPTNRSVVEWRDGAYIPVDVLAAVPVQEIWAALDPQS
jgi:Uma2 family endonuclease